MIKRGPKPKGSVRIEWSSNFAYAIGLLTTDGSLSKNGRHISLASKDKEQLVNFLRCLKLTNRIGNVYSGKGRLSYRVQCGDVMFYDFLVAIGLTPNKSKTIGKIKIPRKYFFDFLRGHLDGDGTITSYFDPRWQNSFLCYSTFVSASAPHISWLQKTIFKYTGCRGHVSHSALSTVYQLRYATNESQVLWKEMYWSVRAVSLSRKRLKVQKVQDIIAERRNRL